MRSRRKPSLPSVHLPSTHPSSTRTWRACSAVLGLAFVSAACAAGSAGSPSDEAVGAKSSALDPSGVIPATTYTVQLTIPDTTAQEPTDLAPPWWTPDKAFNYWAEVAAKVGNGSGALVGPINNSACVLGAPNNSPGHTGELGPCQAGTMQNGAFTAGQPLSVPFTITGPNDVVTVAVAIDDLESADPTTIVSHTKDDLAAAGDTIAGAGAILGAFCPWCGAIVGAIGAGLSISSDLMPDPNNNNPAYELTCAGGLMGNPAGSPAVRPDTLLLQFTPTQLAEMTSSGPATLTYGATTSTPFSSGYGSYCNVYSRLQVTIARQWSTGSGPAASAKSSDSAVVEQVNGMDHFSVITSPVPGVLHEFLAPDGAWSSELISANSTASTKPVFHAGTTASVAAISRSPTSFDVFFVDDVGSLWWAFSRSPGNWNVSLVTSAGAISSPPAGAHVTAVSPIADALSVFWISTNGAVYEWSIPELSIDGTAQPPGYSENPPMSITAPSLGTPGAPIASVARTAGNIDLFFAGKDALNGANGGIWTASMSGGTWNTTYPAYPVYVNGSWTTYELPYTSGIVAQGAGITAAAESEGNLDVFYAGVDGGIWTSSWNLANPAYNGAPFSNGLPAYLTSEVPGTKGLATSGQPLSAVSPQPAASEIPNTASTTPGSLQVAWAGPNTGHALPSVYVSALIGTTWGAPTAIVTPQTVTLGAMPSSPISIIAPSSSRLAVLFEDGTGSMHAATWAFGNPSYAVSPAFPGWKWQGWDNIQGGLVSDPVIAAPNASQLYAAANGPNGTIWVEQYDGIGSWDGWLSLGNKGNAFTDGPAMVAVGNDKLEVFVRDPVTSHLLHQEGTCAGTTWCNQPTWNAAGWEDLGGTLIAGTPTVVVSQPNNQINVFATFTDGSAHLATGTAYGNIGVVYEPIRTPTGQIEYLELSQQWANLSGGILSEPGAASWGANRLDVFARGTNNQLYHRYSTDNGVTWTPTNGNWEGLGGSVISTPTVVSWGANRLDVFVEGSAGQVNHEAWSGSAWAWDTVSGIALPLGNVRPNAIARGVGLIDVFAPDAAGSLFTSTLNGSGWSAWAELAICARTNGTPAVVSRDGTNLDLLTTGYAANGDGNVWHDSTTGVFANQNTSAPPACH